MDIIGILLCLLCIGCYHGWWDAQLSQHSQNITNTVFSCSPMCNITPTMGSILGFSLAEWSFLKLLCHFQTCVFFTCWTKIILEWLLLQLNILDVLGWDLRLENGHPVQDHSWCSQVLQGNWQDDTSNSIHTNHPVIWYHVIWASESTPK